MTNAELDQLVAEARGWQSRWNAGRVTPRTGVLMGGLLGALTALREENERLKAFADEMQAFAAEMEKHPQTFRANQTVAYSIRLALKRHTPNPTGDK